MSAQPLPLRRDPANGYVAGVCAGFANWTGIDPLAVRLGVVLLSLLLTPMTILLCLVVGLIAPQD